MSLRKAIREWLQIEGDPLATLAAVAPDTTATVTEPQRMRVSDMALADTRALGGPQPVWVRPEPAPGVAPIGMAMDRMPGAGADSLYAWAVNGAFSEGLGFLGYPYLAELSQRPEYRLVAGTMAREATRKWVAFTGVDETKIAAMEAAVKRFKVRDVIREVIEHDGFFGRGQVFMDFGDADNPAELAKPLVVSENKIGKGKLRNLKPVEPVWSYPGRYETSNPLKPDYYRPSEWFVMGRTVSATRLITFVGREVPDMLKPAYAFGGLSLSQMIKPYVDNWLRTRQSVSDLIHSFSTMVLSTDMSTILAGGQAAGLLGRLKLFTQSRDNRGVMAINKDTEELTNVSTPLGTLDQLQSQSLEQIASVAGIPLVILLGVTPSGLNASSDGEVRTFYDKVNGYQEHVLRPGMTTIFDVIQLNEFGAIDPKLEYRFNPLWEMSEVEAATVRKTNSETDGNYINAGVVDPAEVRERIAEDDDGLYHSIDLSGPPPEPEPEADDAPPARKAA